MTIPESSADGAVLPKPGPAPIIVEVARGSRVESRHRVACAIVEAGDEGTVAAWGDTDRPVYPRSAVKPIQALPFVETGAADAYGLGPAEIALACASHNGEPAHVELVRAWLGRLGLAEEALECGVHPPLHEPAARALAAAGESPGPAHNNCSGKHAAMLTTALHLGEDPRGYAASAHPVQRRVARALADMAGCRIDDEAAGVDGCSLPTYALPLVGVARAMARLAAPRGLGEARADTCRRVTEAMAARPDLVAGHRRACTAIIEATGGRVLVKTGAEGVYAAAVPGMELGLALKVEDGAGRAAEVAVIAALAHVGALEPEALTRLLPFAAPVLRNHRGFVVGAVRVAGPGSASGGGV